MSIPPQAPQLLSPSQPSQPHSHARFESIGKSLVFDVVFRRLPYPPQRQACFTRAIRPILTMIQRPHRRHQLPFLVHQRVTLFVYVLDSIGSQPPSARTMCSVSERCVWRSCFASSSHVQSDQDFAKRTAERKKREYDRCTSVSCMLTPVKACDAHGSCGSRYHQAHPERAAWPKGTRHAAVWTRLLTS
jgi:hypothetical protein